MKTILVALDGSPRSETVLDTAVKIANANGAKLILFRAFGMPVSLPAAYTGIADLAEALRAEAANYLESVAARLPPALIGRTSVALGVPWQAICDAARAESADLVVIGSHGYSGWDHVLGTTAGKIANHIDRSLLIVREPGSPSKRA